MQRCIPDHKKLGFYTRTDEDGNLHVFGYDSKQGQEDLFFKVIAPYVTKDSYLEWMGEDSDIWKWDFSDGKLVIEI